MKNLILCTLLIVSCSTPKESTKVPTKDDPVKPGAPTTLESQVFQKRAKLNLRFASAGENVSVTISGIDGVTVTAPGEALSSAAVKAGEVKPFEVAFTGRGHLVISVRGTFGGAAQARVHSVAIGDVQLKDDGKVLITNDGDAVKLMP